MYIDMVKLKDVADVLGVSEATVSLALNQRPGVNAETRKRVLETARQLGYTPNHIARGLAMNKTHTLGLIVTDIENPFFGTLTKHIDEAARELGYGLVFSVSNNDIDEEESILATFVGKRLDGIIIIPSVYHRRNKDTFERMNESSLPYVFATSYYPGLEADCVMTDLAKGSYELTKYLLDQGYRKIGFLSTADKVTPPTRLRLSGYYKALEHAGLPRTSRRIIECHRPDYFSGYDAVTALDVAELPEAIIAINDILALGAQHALLERGLRIPEDISVAGYDDVIFSSLSEIPLTTVKQDIPHIAKTAVEMLVERVEHVNTPIRSVRIKPELVVRSSTRSSS